MRVARVATIKEVEELLPLGRMMYDEAVLRFGAWSYDEDVVRKLALAALNPWGSSALFGCWAKDGTPAGFFMGYVAAMWFSREVFAGDYGLYIRPEFRNTRESALAACKLVDLFETWARESGARQVTVGVTAGIRDESATKLYCRLEYAPSGMVFMKTL